MKSGNTFSRLLFALILLSALSLLLGCAERSVEAEEEDEDIDPPITLVAFNAEASSLGVKLTWEELDEDENEAYEEVEGILIVRGEGAYPNAYPLRDTAYAVGDALGGGTVLAVLPPTAEELNDQSVDVGKTYYYEAITYDDVPNYAESARLAATPGSLVQGRVSHSQTTLANGRVLLTGGIGYNAGPLDTAEIFDPQTLGFRKVIDEMSTERFGHTATRLTDGSVLLTGGYQAGFVQVLDTAEIFDPETETFRRLESQLSHGRAVHTATLLPDGRVLLAGGTDGIDAMSSLEIFDPNTQQFTELDDELLHERYGHQAVLVEDRVILLGGFDGYEALAYAAAVTTDDLSVTDIIGAHNRETEMIVGRLNPTVVPLADGTWLIAGGFTGPLESGAETATTEIFDPAVSPFFFEGAAMLQPRSGHRAASLSDGRVLVTGGIQLTEDLIMDQTEIYDPATGVFSATGSLIVARTVPEIGVLPNGSVLVTGGNTSIDTYLPEPASTAEIYDPATGAFSVVGADN